MAKKKRQIELPDIELEAFGESREEKEMLLEVVQDEPGFPSMCMMLVDVILRRADLALFDFSPVGTAIKYQIDGIWHPMPAMGTEDADAMLRVVKQIGGANPDEMRARQESRFQCLYGKSRFKFRIISQGMKNGERIALYIDFKRPPMETLHELGMRESLIGKVTQTLNASNKLVVCAAMPGEGYTSLWRAILAASDRFTRDAYVVEDVVKQEPEVINVTQVTFDSRKGENSTSPMRALMLREPNTIAFADLPSNQVLNQICELSEKDEVQTFTRIHGKNAIDALARMIELKPDLGRLSRVLSGIIAMRVVRKLCTTCRLPFQPSPKLLHTLGIPPGRIRQLYRSNPYQDGQVAANGETLEPCRDCLGTGFLGRTGLFEFLEIDAPVAQAISQGASLAQLSQIVSMGKHVSMRDEAVLMAAKGITSLEEIQRVLNK
ncbi:MAG: ATPase, T2SS/T4P/T4SS family [Pirellulaceae bacterium]